MSKILTPIILCGGNGKRLWPLSRKTYPKQFLNLIDDISLFQKSVLRLNSSDQINFSPPIILTNSDYRFIVEEQLKKINIEPESIIIEPEAKNTAPAILAACLYALQKDENSILLVSPSDQIIPNTKAFHKAVLSGIPSIENEKIVTFGISPTRPETGYGYLELAKKSINETIDLINFVEKPNIENAKNMIRAGNYLWNAGIFMFKAKKLIEAFKKHQPELIEPVTRSIKNSRKDLSFFRLNENDWAKCKNISVDYGIMENLKNLVVVPFSEHWSDLGGWNSVWEEMGPNKNGLVLSNNAHAIDCNNTLLRSENKNQEIVGIGLNNIVAIAMNDAVLVAHKDQSQNVNDVVKMLKKKKVSQADTSTKHHRPWGWFETLIMGNQYQVKRILVNPGGALSLQSHKFRSENWVVVEGTAKVTINDEVFFINKGQSTYIPAGALHRLENPESFRLIIIEVQTGTYLGEDDIIRYKDSYSRIP